MGRGALGTPPEAIHPNMIMMIYFVGGGTINFLLTTTSWALLEKTTLADQGQT